MHRSTAARSLSMLLVCAGISLLGGCYSPGGSGFSTDTHTYVSTSWQPYTVTVQDTRTRQNLWSIDVPVGKQLVVHFRAGDGVKGSDTPDLMEWEIMDAGEMFGQLDNSVPVPADRQLLPTLRPTPELPGATTATTTSTGPSSGASKTPATGE